MTIILLKKTIFEERDVHMWHSTIPGLVTLISSVNAGKGTCPWLVAPTISTASYMSAGHSVKAVHYESSGVQGERAAYMLMLFKHYRSNNDFSSPTKLHSYWSSVTVALQGSL